MDTASSAAVRPSNRRAFSAVLRIFAAPSSVLADVKAGLPWWPGLVIWVVLALLFMPSGLLMLDVQYEALTRDASSGQAQGMTLDEDGQLPAPVRYGLIGAAFAMAIIVMPLVLLASTFFYWLALTITFGGAPYRRLFTLSTYTGFIGMAYQIINSLYLRFAGLEFNSMQDIPRSSLKLSLGALVEGEGFLPSFLNMFGVFELWWLGIYLTGVALLLDRRRGIVAAPVLVVFLVTAVGMAFIAALGARLGG